MSSKNTLVTLEASVDSIVSLADPRLPYEHSLEIIAPNAITPKLTSNISDLMSEGFEEIYWSRFLIESEVVYKECLYLFMIRDPAGQAVAMTTLHRSERNNTAKLHWLVVGEAVRQKGLSLRYALCPA